MTELERLKEQYIKKFGGYPNPLLRGLPDSEIIKLLADAIKSGREIEAPDDNDY